MPGGDPNPPGDTETAALRKLVGAGKGVSGDTLFDCDFAYETTVNSAFPTGRSVPNLARIVFNRWA